MNEKPHYKDTSGAIKERLVPILVPFARSKEKRDLTLFDRMRTETGAFAVTCITYALAARKRSYYPLSSDMKEIMYELETIANPLKAFGDITLYRKKWGEFHLIIYMVDEQVQRLLRWGATWSTGKANMKNKQLTIKKNGQVHKVKKQAQYF